MDSMTPSKSMTAGQIDKAVSNYRALLEKHALQFGSEPVQNALGNSELAESMFNLFRTHVEAVSNMIVRRVKVDRTRTPQQVIDATGRKRYADPDAISSIPHLEGDEVDVHFFKIGREISCADLEKQYALHGLKPDPYAQVAVNEADPAFADDHPNGTQWKGEGGYAYVALRRWFGERRVHCYRGDGGWDDDWWFAGVRK